MKPSVVPAFGDQQTSSGSASPGPAIRNPSWTPVSVGDRVVLRCPGPSLDCPAVVAGISSKLSPEGRRVDRIWLRLLEREDCLQLGKGETLEIDHPGREGTVRLISRVLKVVSSDRVNAIIAGPVTETVSSEP